MKGHTWWLTSVVSLANAFEGGHFPFNLFHGRHTRKPHPNKSQSQNRLIVEDDLGRQQEVFFANFSEPLKLALLRHDGPAERTLLLFARLEALAREHNLITAGENARLFGLYWDSEGSPDLKKDRSAAAVVISRVPERVLEPDLLFTETRVGPHVVMHQHGEHSKIGGLYSTIYNRVFEKWDLENRTSTTDSPADGDESTTTDETTAKKSVKKKLPKRSLKKSATSTTTATTTKKKGAPAKSGDTESTEESSSSSDRPEVPSESPVLEEYGMVPSTAIAWSPDLVTVLYVPIASIPRDVTPEALT